MRAKAQAMFHEARKTKLCEKGRLEKAKSGREVFCAEEAYIKVLRAQRWVKPQNVKFRQGNNYRQRPEDYFANRDMGKE